jgi:ATP-binding cassette subfamily B (MDR/TAP) protein 1
LNQTLSHKLRRQTFHDILRQDLQFFDRPDNSTGALASRADSNPQSVFELMGFNIGLIFIAMLNVVGCSILGLAHSRKLGLVIVFGGLPPLLSTGWLKIRLDMKQDHSVSKKSSTSASIASEAITAIRTVSSLAIEEHVLARYTTELDHAVAQTVKPLSGVMVCFALMQAIEYWFMALGFWYVAFPERFMCPGLKWDAGMAAA